ncbi:hypothetical protein LOTGIDRAFT_172492 [Lottia gigantea]|uniref:Cation/H+ exchanger transmembrane domain-containing protein n=1 Tax=Lottia gigantea TaxID=225164 RepID=V4B261_LOTGI|nr:hypothetical protein LOTGIDRAFT_172492 [Lottia gigantea]ESP01736.1 hypothetical protein LOTGIDRAFT_172492 [Lottia gigantea]
MGNKLIFKCLLLLSIVILVQCSSESHHSPSGIKGNNTNQTTDHGIHVIVFRLHHIKTTLVFTCVLILAGAAKLAFNFADYLSSKVPESCMLIVVGTILGAIIEFSNAGDEIPTFFEPNQFFMFLLPPIILESSFSLHDRTFIENLGSILLFAVVGTILACFMLGGSLYGLAQAGAMGTIVPISFVQMLVFTSLIVAVDPVAVLAVFEEIGVNHVLYFLVFGESLLNDGVAVVNVVIIM